MADAAPLAPPPETLDRLRRLVGDPNVDEGAKRQAVDLFKQQYETTAPPAGPATPPPPEAAGEVRSSGVGGAIRAALPRRGPIGALAETFTEPGALGATLGSAAALAVIPETGGASALLLPALAAGAGGAVGREVGIRAGYGRAPTWTERTLGFLVDALPVAVGSALQRVILSPAEIEAAAGALTAARGADQRGLAAGEKAIVREQTAAVTAPVPEVLPAKPGPAPRALKPVPMPEAAPGVPTGALSPLPGAPVPPTVGPEMTRVAADSLKSTEREAGVKYAEAGRTAAKLNLSEPVPQHIIRAASDAIDALDRSGLEPEVRNGARTLLESIRDVQGEAGAGAALPVTYNDLDAWRQKLQEYAPAFVKLGQSQSFEKGSLAHVLGLVKDDMAKMAQGTEVETLHRTAEDFFIHEVQPARNIARSILKGEVEPNALIDAFTKRSYEHRFVRYMNLLDRKAPSTAAAFRRAKYQNMIDRATSGETFRPNDFVKELDTMPGRTREALLRGTTSNEIKELLHNIEQAKAGVRATQMDAQAEAEAAHAQAQATHDQAVADYQDVVTRNATAKQQYRTARDAAKAVPPELVSARRKLSSQQMLLQAPPAILTGVHALQAAMAGNANPFFIWLGSGAGMARAISLLMSSPAAIAPVNRLFRLAGAGASPSVIARTASTVAWHLAEGAGRVMMRPSPLEATPEVTPEATAP